MNVFISYKRNATPDHGLARALEAALINAGCCAFRDEATLLGGDRLAREIRGHLHTAEVVVVLVSNAAMGSRWVLNEIDEALKLGKSIVPVMIEELDDELSFTSYRPRLGDLLYVEYMNNEADMIHAVLAAIGKQILPMGHVATVVEAMQTETLGPMYVVKSPDGKLCLTDEASLSPISFGSEPSREDAQTFTGLNDSMKQELSNTLRTSGPLNAAVLASRMRLKFAVPDDEPFKAAVRELVSSDRVVYLVDKHVSVEGLSRYWLGWRTS